jgi:uncharacterized protein
VVTPAAAIVPAAFLAGIVDSMVGGGGMLQLPVLFSALPTAAPAALLGTSKLAGALGTGVAAARYRRHVALPSRLLAAGSVIGACGALVGAILATRVTAALYRPIVPVLLAVVLLATLSARNLGMRHEACYDGRRVPAAAAGVAAIAVYDGFFGPGTGSFLMYLLMRTLRFDFLHAAAGARVLNLSTNVAALGWFALHGALLPRLGLTMAAANIAGSLVGTRLALRGGAPFVRRAFVVVVTLLIVKTAIDGWRILNAP